MKSVNTFLLPLNQDHWDQYWVHIKNACPDWLKVSNNLDDNNIFGVVDALYNEVRENAKSS